MFQYSCKKLRRPSIFYPDQPKQDAYKIGLPSVNHSESYVHDPHRTRDPSAFLRRNTQEIARLRSEAREQYLIKHGVSPESFLRLQYGCAPSTDAQRRVAQHLDTPQNMGYHLTAPSTHLAAKDISSMFILNPSYRYKLLEERRELRYLHGQLRSLPRRPSLMFVDIMRHRAQNELRHEKIAQKHRRSMEEATGITCEQRLDAYMLGDTTIFPHWIRDRVPVIYRDRVWYGGLGITEYDEVLRQKLLRLPMQERQTLWSKLKAQREIEDGTERMITPFELKEVITCRRRKYHWLLRRRMEHIYQWSVVAQRYPGTVAQLEHWPSDRVDYSSRLNLVAKSVRCVSVRANAKEDKSAALGTAGAWPLHEERIQSCLEQLEAEDELDEVLSDCVDIVGAAPATSAVNPYILKTLRTYEYSYLSPQHTRKKIPWLSRREYQHRWSAVFHGYRDELGRKRVEAIRPWRNNQAIHSFEEWAQRNETLGEPKPWRSKEYHRYAQLWCAKYKNEYGTFKQDLPRH